MRSSTRINEEHDEHDDVKACDEQGEQLEFLRREPDLVLAGHLAGHVVEGRRTGDELWRHLERPRLARVERVGTPADDVAGRVV